MFPAPGRVLVCLEPSWRHKMGFWGVLADNSFLLCRTAEQWPETVCEAP